MLEFKNPITIRSGHQTCPLPLALEAYWACEADCLHCVGRRLNKIWGEEQRMANPVAVERKLRNALKRERSTTVSKALFRKKAFFLGRKADPYQPIELKKRITKQLIEVLQRLDWSFAVCSRYQSNMEIDTDLFLKRPDLTNILIEITPGLEKDRELFERNRTTPVLERLRIAKKWQDLGLNVGVRGEPFIPGYHTIKDFKKTLMLLKSYGIKSYNTYNLHMNEYTMKRLHAAGLDIEKIWTLNQDNAWKHTQRRLCQIAEKENIILGCPDFVNQPIDFNPKVNTCCGIDIKDAFTYNTHNWRQEFLKGYTPTEVLDITWEGIGTDLDIKESKIIVNGEYSKDLYTFKDLKL